MMKKPTLKYMVVLILLLTASMLPLRAIPDGFYLLSYTKTSSFPELEAQYRAMGLDIRQNSIETYKGIVLEMEDDSYLDPVELLGFSISRKGEISCPSNPTVTGFYNRESGEFHWEGYIGFHDQLKYSESRGILERIDRGDKARMENCTVFLLEDNDGNQLTASMQDGFIILKNEEDTESAYQGWPILIGPDGTFSSYFDLSTEVITGQNGAPPIIQAVHNAVISTEGRITKESGIQISFYNDYAMNRDQQEKPGESFSGRVLNTQEISSLNDNSYADFKVRLREEIDRTASDIPYPAWFLSPPVEENRIYGAGCRTLPDREKALQMAETIAAAVLANQMRVSIQASSMTSQQDDISRVQQSIEETSREELMYTVMESLYDEKTQTAYVLVSMEKEKL